MVFQNQDPVKCGGPLSWSVHYSYMIDQQLEGVGVQWDLPPQMCALALEHKKS